MTKKSAKKNIKIGDVMSDGTIYAGISPDTKQPMYAAPTGLCMRFTKAAEYAKNLKVGGKKGFRVPSKAELNVLFKNREKGALKGTFNLTGSDRGGNYWSSTSVNANHAWYQKFSSGDQSTCWDYVFSVRCVR